MREDLWQVDAASDEPFGTGATQRPVGPLVAEGGDRLKYSLTSLPAKIALVLLVLAGLGFGGFTAYPLAKNWWEETTRPVEVIQPAPVYHDSPELVAARRQLTVSLRPLPALLAQANAAGLTEVALEIENILKAGEDALAEGDIYEVLTTTQSAHTINEQATGAIAEVEAKKAADAAAAEAKKAAEEEVARKAAEEEAARKAAEEAANNTPAPTPAPAPVPTPAPVPSRPSGPATASLSISCPSSATLTVTATGGGTVTLNAGGRSSSGSGSASLTFDVGAGSTTSASASAPGSVYIGFSSIGSSCTG